MRMSRIASVTFANVPSPRRESVASRNPSTLMAGTKLATRAMSSTNASSMSVALVNERNRQSGCSSHSRMRSRFRTRGSPPV